MSHAEMHPLVRKTKLALEGGWKDPYGRIRPQETGCLNLAVSSQNIQRAMNLWSELIRTLQSRGYRIEVDESGNRTGRIEPGLTVAIVEGERIEISMLEYRYRIKTPANVQDGPRVLSRHLFFSAKYFCDNGIKRAMRGDSKGTLLEDRLDDFIYLLIAFSSEVRRRRVRLEEEKRLAQQELQRKNEERYRIKCLFERLEKWEKRESLLQFLDAVEKDFSSGDVADKKWLKWARKYVMSGMDRL